MIEVRAALQRYWGYEQFRPLQEQIIGSILAGRDVAVVMPTGGGKSLCYQLPAVVMSGTTIVLSPLIALMQDQAAQLAQAGIPAAALNSSLNWPEQQMVLRQAREGAYRLIYLSPERLARADTLEWLRTLPLTLFAIDEAHCISEWGHEFRPEYRQLSILRQQFPDVPIAAFTASATRRVRHDILAQLRLRDPAKFIVSFHRPNLRYTVRQCDSKTQKRLLLAALAAHSGSSVIVYASTIAGVEKTAEMLSSRGIAAVPYHGKMENDLRTRNQDLWMSDESPVMVGTLAFGLGINKPSVRAVIHLALPKSIEQYYQEAGRAGRDGAAADCLLLWQKRDLGLLAHFNEQIADAQERERSWQRYHAIRRFAEEKTCRHRAICLHFGETPKWERCDNCDVCAAEPDYFAEADATLAIKRAPRKAAAANTGLREQLRQWRLAKARELKVAPFVILHDTTLDDLTRRLPQSFSELRGVHGIGERKAASYGEEILSVIAAYNQSTG